MKRLAILCAALAAGLGSAPALELTEEWRLGGFKSPESVIVDTANNRIIIGNMGTFGPDAGADGYLSLVSMEGELVESEWVTGLADPKGMAIVDGMLYVADSTGLVQVSIGDAAIVSTVPLEGAVFPNDAAADAGGAVYVSDLMGEAIYKVHDGVAERWLTDEALTLPNGLYVDGGRIVVGSMGRGMRPDFSTEAPGGLITVEISSKQVAAIAGASDLGGLDGVGKIGDTLITNVNSSGTLYGYVEGGTAESLIVLTPGAADLYTEGDRVLVPVIGSGELIALSAGE